MICLERCAPIVQHFISRDVSGTSVNFCFDHQSRRISKNIKESETALIFFNYSIVDAKVVFVPRYSA